MKPSPVRQVWCALVCLVFLFSFHVWVSAQTDENGGWIVVDEIDVSARLDQTGNLLVTIPVREGELKKSYFLPIFGSASASIIDLDDNVLTKTDRSALFISGGEVSLLLPKNEVDFNNPETLVLNYEVKAKSQQIDGRVSLARSMGTLELVLLGSDQLLAGGKTGFRIIAREHYRAAPVADAIVTAKLKLKESEIVLQEKVDSHGTVDIDFEIPADWKGAAQLDIEVNSPVGTQKISRGVNVVHKVRTMLVTDKPLYQPGQTIHIRSLTLAAPDRQALGDSEIILEVLDAKGNKVFKKIGRTDRMGVFAADFVLADELNLGDYTVRSLVGDLETKKSVNVSRYVLPKFKVQVNTAADFFLPGQTVKGTVRADYTFGKPVAGGKVIINASKFDLGFESFALLEGSLDDQGRFEFEFKVPDYFVGQPLLQGDALVKLEAEVTDRAEHKQAAVITLPVAQSPLTVVAIPESGQLVAGVENIIFLAFRYADGKPGAGVWLIDPFNPGSKLVADDLGIVAVKAKPGAQTLAFNIEAKDNQGNKVNQEVRLDPDLAAEQIMLRTDKAIYQEGDQVVLTALTSAKRAGSVYFDIIHEGQPVAIMAADLKDGQAQTKTTLAGFSGTIQFRAYFIGENTDVISDSKISYVNPANELTIRIKPDKKSYRPGEPVRVDFTVTDRRDHPVLAVLGLNIVDEAVFALQDSRPGLEKVFYTLEAELMKSRYEIHQYEAQTVAGAVDDQKTQKAYQVLLASIDELPQYAIQVNTQEQKDSAHQETIWRILANRQEEIRQALSEYQRKKGRFPKPEEGIEILIAEGFLEAKALIDPWGNRYEINFPYPDQPIAMVLLTTYGPDEKKGTSDDVSGARYNRNMKFGGGGQFEDNFDMFLEAEGMAQMALGAKMPRARGNDKKGDFMAADMPMAAEPVSDSEKAGIRVREFFPETLLFEPALITDEKGRATLTLDMADSITTWRLSATGSTQGGLLGSATAPLLAFQDFFVDIDFPVALTEGDTVEVPVAVYNYLDKAQVVRLQADPADWYTLLDGQPTKKIELKAGEVSVVHFPIRADKIGSFDFTVWGIGSQLKDAIRREIEVQPNGKEILVSETGRIEGSFEKTIEIPEAAIDDASKIFVKIYPGLMSQVLEGMDNIFRMPSGCFEQTSSTTYPNVIVLDYLKKTGTITPEIQMKAEGFINQGYQRLLSFEVPGGGFEWFGSPPAHKILTAYGLMEFYDMSQVYNVDPQVIRRTQRWLADGQEADGSFEPNTKVLDTVASKFTSDVLRNTAYITWSLAYSGDRSQAVKKGLDYLRKKSGKDKDAYTLALIANAFAAAEPNGKDTKDVIERLLAMAKHEDGKMFWQAQGATPTMARGVSADIETTALAAQALIRQGTSPETINKVINFLVENKDAYGTWHSTQATVYAIKALTMSLEKAAEGVNGEVMIYINDQQAGALVITPEDSDVLRLVDLKQFTKEGNNRIRVTMEGKGAAMVQIVGRFYLPWKLAPKPKTEPISIEVDFDRTALQTGDLITQKVIVKSNRPGRFGMVVVDLGVPPGFSVETGDLAELVGDGTIKKFSVTGRQVIVYLDEVAQDKPVSFSYRLKAKYPIRAQTPSSRVYEYYNPAAEDFAKPVQLVIK